MTLEDQQGEWDADIADMALSELEKNGLQVFRNYQVAFERRRLQAFAEKIDDEAFDTRDLESVLQLIATDDQRLVPVVGCAFADDTLKAAFKALLADRSLDKSGELLGPLGPLGDLSKRIQMAGLAGVISVDLVGDVDRLRAARNRIAHAWEQRGHDDLLSEGGVSKIFPVETLFDDPSRLFVTPDDLTPIKKLRLRTIWMMARLAYEGPLYWRAGAARLNPHQALYESARPNRLSTVSGLAADACRIVLSAP